MRLEYSPGVRRLLANAQKAAGHDRHRCVHTEYILLGLLEGRSAATRLLQAQGVNLRDLYSTCKSECRVGDGVMKKELRLTHRAEHVLELAEQQMRHLGHDKLDSRHILIGLLMEPDGIGGEVLREMGVTANAIREAILLEEAAATETIDTERPSSHVSQDVPRPLWKKLLRV